MKEPFFFLIAGEKSGDLHGEKLIEALYRSFPGAQIRGVGGPRMRSAGLDCVIPMESFEVMGFVDVFLALPRLIKLFFQLRKILLENPPEFLLTIDYPGFNFALAKSLKKRGFKGKISHFICPSVWAWGKRRIPKMEKILDALFVTFPFEEHLFDRKRLSVHYVGHPLVHEIEQARANPIDIDKKLRVLALFPGSREKELHRNFPLQLKVASRLLELHSDLFVAVSVAEPRFSLILDQLIKQSPFKKKEILLIDSSQSTALMQRADLAIAKSGTVNLELALHGVPTVVTYGVGPLDLFIARDLLRIRLPYFSLPNIIMSDEVFPELIGPNFTEQALFERVNQFLTHPTLAEECREKCRKLCKLLKGKTPQHEISGIFQEWTH